MNHYIICFLNVLVMKFPENVTRLCGQKRFSFGCHPGVACFTECCRELELALTPYDVLRLCRELQLKASEFIDRYVVIEEDEKGRLPQLYLGMVDDGRASCPFISEQGCRVYQSRPGACRAYPVGRGVTRDANGRLQEIHVLVREDHCRGFAEPQSHNVAEWFENQGLHDYNTVNDEVLHLLQQLQNHQGHPLTREQKNNYILALYKLDEFHKLVSSAPFQDKEMLSSDDLAALENDDLKLLRFGIRWLQEHLFAETI